jgi:hypothetical protein
MLKKSLFLPTRPTLARRAAPAPRRRSRLESILTIARMENRLSWQLGMVG